ncbi:MAG: glycosyltransferase [Ruminiclostridium sp.]|nr:glycosyltransferase [Ruminiclostridium sp.]
MNPLISVVVPIYNAGSYLKHCLQTIQNQTFSDFEVICVNDGSTDNSSTIIKDIIDVDGRFRMIEREYRSGSAGLPRNIGIDNATGKYIIFLDADDYFDVHLLEKLYKKALQSSSDLIICDCWYVNQDGIEEHNYEIDFNGVNALNKEVFSYKDTPDNLFQLLGCAVWNKLILKELIDRNALRFQENVPIVDDVFFVSLLYIFAGRISIINDKLIYYRLMRPGSQTNSIEKHPEAIFDCLSYLNDYLIKEECYDIIKKSLHNRMLALLRWWLMSVSSPKIYKELCFYYRNTCFPELGLQNMNPVNVDKGLRRFFNAVINKGPQISLDDNLQPDSRLIIYGAGYYGKHIYQKIVKNGKYNVVLWVDKNAKKMENQSIVNPEKILETEYDIIIIAISDDTVVNEVYDYLVDLGVNKNKIITTI